MILQDLLKPTVIVRLNDVDVSEDVMQVTVNQNGHQEADTVSLSLPDTINTYLELGDFYKEHIEVYLGYWMYVGDTQRKVVRRVFNGYTDTKDFAIAKNGGQIITMNGRNIVGKLIDATDTFAYVNQTIEEIVRDQMGITHIASQTYNIPAPLNESPYGSPQESYGTTYEIDNQSIWETITRLASDVGLLCSIDADENFYFGVYEAKESYKFIFDFAKKMSDEGNVINFSGNKNTPNSFYHKCQITGHNDDNLETIYGEAEHIPFYLKHGEGVKGATQLRTLKIANDLAIVPEMANVQAQWRLWEEQRDLFTVSLSSQYGIPYIEPTHLIEINNCPYNTFNRDFWVRNITHSFNKLNGYTMEIFGEVPPYGWRVTDLPGDKFIGVVF